MNELSKIILIVSAVAMYGCTNPFSTRAPEDPDIGTDTSPVGSLQTDPDSILAKFADAFRLRNPQIYVDCLTDTAQTGVKYEFVPDQNDAPRLSFWDRDKEEVYFSNFVQALQSGQAALDYEINSSLRMSPDEHQIDLNYTITAEFINETIVYQGQSFLFIFKFDNELWYIQRWEDYRLTDEQNSNTWSTLRADFQ